MLDFHDKIVFITGASRGIGLATAKMFHDAGALVIGTYNKHKPVYIGARYYQLDITDEAACEEVVEKIYNEHGRIDVLFNNAGITQDALTKKMGGGDVQQRYTNKSNGHV